MTLKTPPKIPPLSESLAFEPISRFMHKPVFYVMRTSSIATAMRIMLTHKVSGVPVVDEQQNCIGLFTEMDALLQGGSKNLNTPIQYSSKVVSVGLQSTFRDALILMVKNRIKRLPVLDANKKILGIVSRGDLMKALFEDNLKAHEPK